MEIDEFRLMRERILETVHPDARSVTGYTSSNMQRCFAIRAGINDLLDIARQTYCELIDDMKSRYQINYIFVFFFLEKNNDIEITHLCFFSVDSYGGKFSIQV